MRRLFALILLLIAAPAAAQPEPEWRIAREEQIRVSPGRFEPDTLRLEAGRPTRLVFFNHSRARVSISAGDLLAASRVRAGDAEELDGGSFSLAPGETRAITLVPREGTYSLGSGSWFRRLLGMRARIVVESSQRTAGQPVTP